MLICHLGVSAVQEHKFHAYFHVGNQAISGQEAQRPSPPPPCRHNAKNCSKYYAARKRDT